jgi:DNA polymerase I-like protein with 3'-5' exonuclease and polymerase domains/uracil-DNA glycosylase
MAATSTRTTRKRPVPRFWRDVAAYHDDTGPELRPSAESPICQKCGLDGLGGARCPYLGAVGADQPLITVIFESVSRREDEAGQLAVEGSRNGLVRRYVEQAARAAKVDPGLVRYVPMTRCANLGPKKVDYKTRGNWCRAHLTRDLAEHPPALIIPVGTVVLGRLSHKSNAQDWGGRLLTYRGWPDDWLTNKQYDGGSPFTGPHPDGRPFIPMVPIQAPYIVWAAQNPNDIQRWRQHIQVAVELARDGTKAKSYDRPWFHIATTPDDVICHLREITPGTVVSYDLETTGLRPFAPDAGIVFAMFRWQGQGGPLAVGFPWLYAGSPIGPAEAERIRPEWQRVLYIARLRGHHISFDLVYTFAQLPGTDLVRMTAALDADTRYMIYALRQTKESLGLERVAYDWCDDMAGYEEEFELLKRREPELLDPAAKKGGHYANVPRELWDSHLKPYVMGDVEVAYVTSEQVGARLAKAKRYTIPLADPARLGQFRDFTPPSREFMYRSYMVPAQRVLTRMMARGMHVDLKELEFQENMFPKLINEARDKLRQVDPRVIAWCQQRAAVEPEWELDLESRAQLKTILFDILELPVKRLTESGRRLLKIEDDDIPTLTRERQVEFAAIDKYTLNGLVAENPRLAPLQEYRKLHKAYTAFVRSMRNITTEGIDKRARDKDPYLQADGRVHTTFNQSGTRAGRLSSSAPNLQQLPRDSIVKRMYSSRFGARGCIYQADLSQIELRLLAAGCGDPLMVRAYREHIDLHSLTTSRIFNVPYDHFEKMYMAELQKRGLDAEAKELNRKRSIGKCVDPATLISVDGRIIRVGDLHPGRTPDTFYDLGEKRMVQVGPHGGSGEIRKFYFDGCRKRVLVCSRKGLLACSMVHRFRLDDGSLVRAEDLKPGMRLCDVTRLENKGGDEGCARVPINPISAEMPERSTFVMQVDTNMAYVLGLFYGDGTANANYVSICTGGKPEHFEWQDTIAKALSDSGFKPTIKRMIWDGTKEAKALSDSERLGLVKGTSGRVVFGSRRVLDLLYQLGAVTRRLDVEHGALVDGKREGVGKTFKVPAWLLNAGTELKLAFIGGLIDTDGCVKKDGSLDIVTKEWVLAQDVMVLLATVGVEYTLSLQWNAVYQRNYFRLNVPVRSACRFIGVLRNKFKASRLRVPKVRGTLNVANTIVKVLPLPDGDVMDISLDDPHLYVPNGLTTHQTTNFLTGYGGGAYGLQTSLAESGVCVSLEECERIVDTLFDTYPALRRHIGLYKRFILDTGVAVSMTGRVRVLNDVFSEDNGIKSKALRSGFNHLIQSTASDLMLICMAVIEYLMREASLESILVSTVHDSIVVDAHVHKMYAARQPGLIVEIREAEPPPKPWTPSPDNPGVDARAPRE